MGTKNYNKDLNNSHDLKYDDAWERAKARGVKLPWESDGNSERVLSKDSSKKLESDG